MPFPERVRPGELEGDHAEGAAIAEQRQYRPRLVATRLQPGRRQRTEDLGQDRVGRKGRHPVFVQRSANGQTMKRTVAGHGQAAAAGSRGRHPGSGECASDFAPARSGDQAGGVSAQIAPQGEAHSVHGATIPAALAARKRPLAPLLSCGRAPAARRDRSPRWSGRATGAPGGRGRSGRDRRSPATRAGRRRASLRSRAGRPSRRCRRASP